MLADRLYEIGIISTNEYERMKDDINKKSSKIHNMIDNKESVDDIIKKYDELVEYMR